MLTPTPQIMLISHKPKLAPATLSAATQPVPKKISSAVPRNSAMHWLESDGCCKAVVIETSFFLLCGAFSHHGRSAVFAEAGSPSWSRFSAGCSGRTFRAVSETKKYRQETLMSKVESEPSVTKKLFVA
ncbi:hypothetical protein [Pseudomonas sp. GV085]|uniref:hypothetical protein n=1 Tax=Pseudomonas sp. GV085 TaxID=2135756 RepID=UPI002113BCBB|nr:hypothetical protein [Pseudomonas sp. GV085]